LPTNPSLPMRRVLADLASWVSPLASRLTTATGRIEFAVADRNQPILRTGRSPPVAPHPASRRRSYHRLRGTRHPPARTSTSPMQQHYRRTSARERGYRYIRTQVAVPGLATYGAAAGSSPSDQNVPLNRRTVT